MANTGRDQRWDQRWLPWSGAGLVALVWLGLIGVVQPTGVIEVAAMVAIALVAALSVALIALVAGRESAVPVRVRAQRRDRSASRNWDAHAPGRPQPRAPGAGRSCD